MKILNADPWSLQENEVLSNLPLCSLDRQITGHPCLCCSCCYWLCVCVCEGFGEPTLEICLLCVPVNFHFLVFHSHMPRKAKRKFAQLSETQILDICLLGYKKMNCSGEHVGFDEGSWFLGMKCSANATGTQVQSLMDHLEVHTDETWLHSQYSHHLNLNQLSFGVQSWPHLGSHMKWVWLHENYNRGNGSEGWSCQWEIPSIWHKDWQYIANIFCLC